MKDLIKSLIEDNQNIDFNETEFDLVCRMKDLNGDKMINYDELYNLFHGDTIDEEDNMKLAFRAYDTNSDGYIDMKELAEFFKLSGKDSDSFEIKLSMAVYDQNNDGKLNYKEFCDMLEGKMKRSSCWYFCFVCCKS